MSGRIFHLCHRCGIEVQPSAGKPRQCRDCFDLEKSSQKDMLIDSVMAMHNAGASQRQIADKIGVNRTTICKWLGVAA